MFKVKLGSYPAIMKDNFQTQECCHNLSTTVSANLIHIVLRQYITESFLGRNGQYFLMRHGQYFLNSIIDNLIEFKTRSKTRVPGNFPCRLCRTYIQNLGFI